MKPVGYRSSVNVAAVLLAYAAFSILLIFLNKNVLSKLHASRESVALVSSSVHFNASASAPSSAPSKATMLIDIDILRLTFTQCAFTAFAIHLVLRFSGFGRIAPRPRFGLSEMIASTLFVVMLISSNLCLKLIPVSVLPVSRSLTFIFVLALDRIASRLNLFGVSSAKASQSLFTLRRCIIYSLILFGYIGAIEVRAEPKANEASMFTGFLCGVFNSLVSALTSLAMKYTMHKRKEEAQRENGSTQPTRGIAASVTLCYAMNLYAASLGAALFILYQLVNLICGASDVSIVASSFSDWLSVPQSFWSTFGSLLYSIANANLPLVGLFAFASCTTVLVSALNLVQLELCTPLTVQISNATKSVALTLIAVAYYREHHALVWYAANLSMLAGTLLYATESHSSSSPARQTQTSTVANENQMNRAVAEEKPQVDEVVEEQSAELTELEDSEVAKFETNDEYSRFLEGSCESVVLRRKSLCEPAVSYTAMPRNAMKQLLTFTRRGKQRSRSRIGSQYPLNGSLKNLHLIKKRP